MRDIPECLEEGESNCPVSMNHHHKGLIRSTYFFLKVIYLQLDSALTSLTTHISETVWRDSV